MTSAVIALSAVVVLLAIAVIGLLVDHRAERREWTAERRVLVDRAIASHVGEVVALDRGARQQPRPDQPERPTAVGLT